VEVIYFNLRIEILIEKNMKKDKIDKLDEF